MILVTGHKGFVGTNLTNALTEPWCGYDLRDGNDIRNEQQLDLFFEQHLPDKVVHLAALAGVRQGEEYPEEYYSTNILGTQLVVNMCEKYGVKHLVNFSSSSVFGGGTPPTKETDDKNPIGVYGISKLAAEHIVKVSNIPQITTVRPFTVYGYKGRPEQVVYKWINQIKKDRHITRYGGDNSNRGYVYVNDLVQGVLSILSKDGAWGYQDFNLGGQEVIGIMDLVEMFETFFPFTFEVSLKELPAVDPLSNFADVSKAKEFLGFDPPKAFRENLASIIKRELNNYV